MRRTIEVGRNNPRQPFGAVIADPRSGEILAEGWNRADENPTWHGEIDALNGLFRDHPGIEARNLALYSTAEPCPMCQSAALWAGIGTVAYGSSIAFLQGQGWWQIDIPSEEVVRRSPSRRCTLIPGILEVDCNALFEAAGKVRNGDEWADPWT